jgi:hypothetical protein
MLSRWAWRLVLVASLATLAGVVYFFYREYQLLALREQVVKRLDRKDSDEGPCAALLEATNVMKAPGLDQELVRSLGVLRDGFAAEVLSEIDDRPGRSALLGAAKNGMLSLELCEQIKIFADSGQAHPVLALLRFTENQDPCEEALALDEVIAGLGSHRAILLRGLLADVGKLRCLTPAMAEEVAVQAVRMLHDDSAAFDDLDSYLQIAAFLTQWDPLGAAQAGCRIEALGLISRLGNAIGCTPDQIKRILPHYRYPHPIPQSRQGPELPADREMVLINQDGLRCEMRPLDPPVRLFSVACSDLSLISDLEVAVSIERVEFGSVHADLISGLVHVSGEERAAKASTERPKERTWFAYNRTGQALGTTQVTSLKLLAKNSDQELPDAPLRAFCRTSGAKYCYDVDWTQLVEPIETAALYLSRPMDIFLREAVLPQEVQSRLFAEAFGTMPAGPSLPRFYTLGEGRYLVVSVQPGGFEARWPLPDDKGGYKGQVFGVQEGGRVPPTARLLAAMDLQRDGRPELIVQRAPRGLKDGEATDLADEILLVELDPGAERFITVTQLTVHEY